MIKLRALFPLTVNAANEPEPLEYRGLVILGPPGMPEVPSAHVVDGEVFLAENYAFVRNDGKGRTTVHGLQTVRLVFEHLESPAETVARAVSTLAAAIDEVT